MNWREVARLIAFDVRAAILQSDQSGENTATMLRTLARELDEALSWAKREVARAIAVEKQSAVAWSAEELAEHRNVLEKIKAGLRALITKHEEVERSIGLVLQRSRRTHSPTLTATRVDVDAVPPHVVSRHEGDLLCLTVSGPPGGIDTLHAYRFPIFDPGYDAIVKAWQRVDPKTHEHAVSAERQQVRIGDEEHLALAYVRPYMGPRHFAVLWVALTPTLLACRQIESPATIPWARFESCNLLRSLRVTPR